MKVLVVDDEPAAVERLEILLQELDAEVVGRAGNGIEALERVERLRPDLILLDIAMPEVDGFDVVRGLPEPRPLVVFQTAFDEFALEAFEHEAVDYVVKPVTLERLSRALERAARRLEGARAPAMTPEVLGRLRLALAGPDRARRPRLLVRDGTGRRLLPFRDVVRFVLRDAYVEADVGPRTYLVDYSLAELEERTAGDFVRANRAELVNLDHVVRYDAHSDGTASLTLTGEVRVHVSRRRAAEVKRALEA